MTEQERQRLQALAEKLREMAAAEETYRKAHDSFHSAGAPWQHENYGSQRAYRTAASMLEAALEEMAEKKVT